MLQSRFEFPGFAVTANLDSSTHQVEVGTLEYGGATFALTMIRNKLFEHLSFLPSRINSEDGTLLWDFKNEQWNGPGMLAMANDQPVIALVTRGKFGSVERVIPLSQVAGQRPDLRTLIQLKRSAAQFLGRSAIFSDAEQAVMKADDQRQRDERLAVAEAQAQARAAAAEARAAAKEELVRKLLARGRITGYTAEGRSRHGIPVLDAEWPRLSNGVHVIVVSSVDDTTGAIGNYLEAFQVIKQNSRNPTKGAAAVVTKVRPVTQPIVQSVKPVRTVAIDTEGGAFPVQLFDSMDDIRTARADGLNGGTFVAVDTQDSKIQVYAVYHDRIDTVGNFVPLV